MAMNKRILDVSGRLSLLGPRPEVVQILKRAGIHNILKVFDSEADLIKSSEDIILQTTSFKVADVKAAIAEELEPQSEFDQLRNEIGSVFGGTEPVAPPKAPTKKTARSKAPLPIEQPIVEQPIEEEQYIQEAPQNVAPTPSVAPSIEQEFDQVFQNFEEAPIDESTNFKAPPVEPVRPQPVQPQFAPQSRQGRPGFVPPQPPQYQAKQFTPPPLQRPVVPPSSRPVPPPPMQRPPRAPVAPQMRSPEPPIQPKAYPVQEPPSPAPEFTAQRPETQPFPTAPAAQFKPPRKQEPVLPEEFEEDLEEFAAPKKKIQPVEEDTFEDEELDEDFEVKKHSPVPIIALVVVLIAIGGAGIFFAISKFSKKPEITSQAPTTAMQQNTPAQQSAVPQLPVETQPTQTQPATPEKASVPTQTPSQNEEPVASKKANKPVVEKKVARTKQAAVPKASVRETEAEEAPSTPYTPPTTPAKLVITSTPSGADVTINGEELGTTPYTWNKPVFGSINVVVSKQGYKENSKSFEFAGGTQKQAFSLEKEVVAPPPPPPQRVIAKSEPAPAPEPADDFADEPGPSVSPTPVSTPAPAAFSSAGGDASIFIASIPPVADVYLNGKLIGKTNVSELKLPSGTHTLRFVKGPKEITKDITVQSGKNPSQMVRIP